MIDTGILPEGSRVEFIEGEILDLAASNKPRAYATTRLNKILVERYSHGYCVRPQCPVVIGDHSEPEPDFAVVTESQLVDSPDHPTEAILLVEVSDSSLAFDRIKKARLYGRAGFPEYWIVNLRERSLIVHKQPYENGYQEITTYLESDAGAPLPLADIFLPQ
ncbi:MAG: Uma2 family endonuclease [Candidatus Eremiobacteraeota bacterium]|nr:Uma2 family endonuclease [Candidatus Eremiobacteraeota bacterium]MCW5867912.1 Uma2 family endonuclease [Candidatus Eremiobacteraeota bacterium]